jgi:hypothetical protein
MTDNGYVILYNDGNLSGADVQSECVGEGWIPIFVLKGRNDGSTMVPMFYDAGIGEKFINRNIPNKSITTGLVGVTTSQMDWMRKRDWKFEYMDFPKRFTTHRDYEIAFEILEGEFVIGRKSYRRGS